MRRKKYEVSDLVLRAIALRKGSGVSMTILAKEIGRHRLWLRSREAGRLKMKPEHFIEIVAGLKRLSAKARARLSAI